MRSIKPRAVAIESKSTPCSGVPPDSRLSGTKNYGTKIRTPAMTGCGLDEAVEQAKDVRGFLSCKSSTLCIFREHHPKKANAPPG